MQFRKIANLLGFTKIELTVITFLLGVFLFGLAVNYYKSEDNSLKNFNYSSADSLFFYSGDNDSSETGSAASRKRVPDLNSVRYTKKAPPPGEKSIELNKAGIDDLMKLPGIGEKTAREIIAHRASIGGFKDIEGLMAIKGIGPGKFGKIKKYIFVEN